MYCNFSKRIPQVNCRVAKKNQREYMEDRHLVAQIELPGKGMIDMIAVFDGHAGSDVVDEVLRLLPDTLALRLNNLSNIHDPKSIKKVLLRTFLDVDYKMYQSGRTGRLLTGGSTGVVALWPHQDNWIYVANLGDSRALLWTIVDDKPHVILETRDHKPSAEIARIQKVGGFVRGGRVGGIMAVSRSFGDYREGLKVINKIYMGKMAPLSAEPDIYTVNVTQYPERIFMVLASDGLWDVFSSKEVVEFFHDDQSKDCVNIINAAIAKGSEDNITVLKVDIPECKAKSAMKKSVEKINKLAGLLSMAEREHARIAPNGKNWSEWYARYLLNKGVGINL